MVSDTLFFAPNKKPTLPLEPARLRGLFEKPVIKSPEAVFVLRPLVLVGSVPNPDFEFGLPLAADELLKSLIFSGSIRSVRNSKTKNALSLIEFLERNRSDEHGNQIIDK
jgi:hypothetical protein